MATIVPAQPENIEDVRRISLSVFDEYGDYGRILPRFFTTQGVTTYVARIRQEVVPGLEISWPSRWSPNTSVRASETP
jgi:hypothetical protein